MTNTKIIKHSIIAMMFSLLLSMNVLAADYPVPGDFQKGAQTWADNCGRCHNIRGAKELRDDQWISTVFHMRVRAGLTGQEARDVLTFLQGSNTVTTIVAKTAPVNKTPATALSGKTIYKQTCIACHGASGSGNLPGVPDLTSKSGPLSKNDSVLLQNITNGFQSPGSPMAMPPKGGNPGLTDADIKSVLKYLHNTFKK